MAEVILSRRQMLAATGSTALAALLAVPAPAQAKPKRRPTAVAGFGRGGFGRQPFGS